MCFDGGERRAFAVADGTDDEVRQGAGEVEVAVACFGVDDALRAFDDVGGVLAGGEVEGEEDVGEMGVGAAHAAGEDAAEVVFARVQRGDFFWRAAQEAFADTARDGELGDDVFAAPEDAIDRARFFVGAVVGGDGAVGELRVFGEQPDKRCIGGFGHHVVAGGVAGAAFQAQVEQVADDFRVQLQQTGKAAGVCDDGGEFCFARADGLQGGEGGCGVSGFEEDGARHAFINNGAAHTAAVFGDFCAARGRGPKRGFVSGKRHADAVVDGIAADGERSNPLGRDGGGVGFCASHCRDARFFRVKGR